MPHTKLQIGERRSVTQSNEVPDYCFVADECFLLSRFSAQFVCKKYTTLTDGSTKVVPKGPGDCNVLGPITSGFNEAACDIFHGTWCPSPRNCTHLVNCLKNAAEEVQRSRDRQAFFEYLDEAPKVKDPDDAEECGDLREYFEYDRDYPDDERICEEVKDLQCFIDFSNLDGFATGTAGPGSEAGLAELAVSDTVKLVTKSK